MIPSPRPAGSTNWTRVCALEDIVADTGVAALVGGREVAIFRVRDALYAIANHDPASGTHVLARGIVGDIAREVVVASPIYKHHYSLVSGRCLEDPALSVPVYLARLVEDQVWVRLAPVVRRKRAAERRRLVVIGNGVAATRTLEELQEFAPDAYEITVFGSEVQGGYSRVLLSPLLAGEKRLADVVTHPPEWYRERGIGLLADDPIEHIDRGRRRVRSRSGIEADYDRLLVATGAIPLNLPVPGSELGGVIGFRDLKDVETMVDAARSKGRAVVVGGGLLGLEAASGLNCRGMDVTVVHLERRLMERQLDEAASSLLRAELESRGVRVVLPARVRRFTGESRLAGVELADGSLLSAELAVVAIGIKPNVALAHAAHIPCGRGILVDDTLATHDPAIYAVGECVEHRGATFGLIAPLMVQARICAAFLAERGVRGYRATAPSAQLKVSGIDVFSAGELPERPGCESLVLRDPKRGVYRRVVIENDRLRGAVLYGDIRGSGWYVDLMNDGRDIRALREELLFGEPAIAGISASER
jgi:nitrite reductase (NADH) large subunit